MVEVEVEAAAIGLWKKQRGKRPLLRYFVVKIIIIYVEIIGYTAHTNRVYSAYTILVDIINIKNLKRKRRNLCYYCSG